MRIAIIVLTLMAFPTTHSTSLLTQTRTAASSAITESSRRIQPNTGKPASQKGQYGVNTTHTAAGGRSKQTKNC